MQWTRRANDGSWSNAQRFSWRYFGTVKIAYTFDRQRKGEKRRAAGGNPTRFRVPSTATDIVVAARFSRHGKPPEIGVTKTFPHVLDDLIVDFSGALRK